MKKASSEAFFYQQKTLRERPKRCRKLPEELPESLKFAHLNPKVAALLANKERQQKQEELNNLANLEKHGVDIGSTFQHLKNQFDSVFAHDEDSHRFLFEEAKGSSCTILEQLSQFLWIFKDVLSPNLIPKSLEYQLMMTYKELTSDVIYLPRDWQTVAIREQFMKSSEIGSEDGQKNVVAENEPLRAEQSVIADHPPTKKRVHKTKVAHPGNEGEDVEVKHEKTTRRSDSKNSTMPSRHKPRVERTGSAAKKSPVPKAKVPSHHGAESPQETRGGLPHINNTNSVIHFELSSKTCEDKGWIMNKQNDMQIERDQVLEWCIQILQKSLKTIATQKEKEVGQDKRVQVRYYGDSRMETMIRYRRSPVKSEVNPAVYGGSPRIPKINDDKHEGKNLMLSGHTDGTSVVYYPSGRPAIVYTSASHGRPGFYTLVYDDDEERKMLACFTPTGTGCVYRDNGTVWFLATAIGGHLADKDGRATRKWKWPTGNVKIQNIINLQMNKAINFRCAAFSQMSIMYNYEKESAKFLVSASASEAIEPNSDENDQLLTTFTFTSNAAKELLRLSYSKLKAKKKKERAIGESDPDTPKILEFPEVTTYGTDAEKDYARLLRKGKGLIEDWMETYRTAFGLASPCLASIQDVPTSRKRYAQSAKPSRFDTETRGATLGMVNKYPYGSARIPSAPAGQTRKTSVFSSKAGGSVKFEDDTGDAHGGGDGKKMSLSLTSIFAAVGDITKLSLSSSPRSRTLSARPKSSIREPVDEATVISNCEACPVVLCQRMMGMTSVNCRCSRYIIPNITDIEFDLFISKVVPNAQLQVIIVVSSLFPKRNEVFELLEQMYTKQNRNRVKPCQQCYCDTFRLLKYDINMAAEHSNHTQPLLLTRHNAIPGMILIYSDGNLLFCDNIFNGYGNTKKDFKKQITKSRLDAVHGVFLPKDFRFKPSQGHHGPRSAWGGEIGGAGVDSYGSPGTSKDDVILHRPSSSSTLDGQVPDKLRGLDASNFICLSLSTMGYRPKSQIVRTRHKLPTAVK